MTLLLIEVSVESFIPTGCLYPVYSQPSSFSAQLPFSFPSSSITIIIAKVTVIATVTVTVAVTVIAIYTIFSSLSLNGYTIPPIYPCLFLNSIFILSLCPSLPPFCSYVSSSCIFHYSSLSSFSFPSYYHMVPLSRLYLLPPYPCLHFHR